MSAVGPGRLVIRYETTDYDGKPFVCEWVLQGADLDPPNWSRLAHVFGELYISLQLGCVGEEIIGHDENCECAMCRGGEA